MEEVALIGVVLGANGLVWLQQLRLERKLSRMEQKIDDLPCSTALKSPAANIKSCPKEISQSGFGSRREPTYSSRAASARSSPGFQDSRKPRRFSRPS